MKILIPVDGSPHSNRAILKGKKIMKYDPDIEIVLLNVWNYFPLDLPRNGSFDEKLYLNELRKRSDHILNEAVKYFVYEERDKVKTDSVRGDVAKEIIKYAEDNFDLIIMGSEGINAGNLKGIFVGSVTKKVLNQVNIPVLVVK